MTSSDDSLHGRHWARIQDLVEAAQDLSGQERKRFLDGACASDHRLREAVDRLLAAASPTDDFLERPAFVLSPEETEAPLFRPDDVLAGRFRIVRLMGRGGMGEVYQALDLELGTSVALKTLRAAMASDPRAVERFRSEVLRARTVAHPNVCRVYDLFSHESATGPLRFLTMELLEGETVASHLALQGPLSPDRLLPLARQIASALDEAHRLGVVHRDLKPSNIMLVGPPDEPRAVVTDFGIALTLSAPAEADPDAPGTESYMAPEQREAGVVGPEADLYAFGIVLHEMLTGRLPTAPLAVDSSPAKPARLDPEVPEAWAAPLRACLSTAPAARPRSAAGVVRMVVEPARRPRPWRLLAGLTAASVALYLPFSRFNIWRPETPAGAEIVLADLVNETAEPDLAALTELFRQQLGQSPFVTVVEPQQVREALRRMVRPAASMLDADLAREVAWRRGSQLVVSGRVWRPYRGYGMTLAVEGRPARPDARGRSWGRSYEARDRDELRRAVHDAANWIRTTAGEAASDIPKNDRAVEDVTTSSWQALDLFARAERLVASSAQEDALVLLEEAVRIDPDFALAWMRMGDVLMSRRQFDEAYQRWNTALAVYRRRKLSPREEYRIRGMYASDTEDYTEAQRVYRLHILSYPNDPAPYFYIARPLLMLGRLDEAVRALEEAQKHDPLAYRVPAQLAMFCLRAERLDAAAVHIAKLREMGQTEWADTIQGASDFLAGRYGPALHVFEQLEEAPDGFLRSRATALQAALLAETGREEEALSRLRRGAQADADAGAPSAEADKLLAMAALYLGRQREKDCRDSCLRARQLDRAPLRLIRGAALLARAGYPAEAADALKALEPSAFARNVQVGQHLIRGEMLLARQQPRAAWLEFQQAAALAPPGALPEYLARGAEAAGERGLALSAYQRMAAAPGYYWRYPDSEPPGSWAEALRGYLRLAPGRVPETELERARQRYQGLRSTVSH